MDVITPQNLEQLRKIMIDRIETLKTMLAHSAGGAEEAVEPSVDEQLLAEHRQELKLLLRNITWLGSDDGGYCVDCGEPIPINRLKAVPTTQHCIHCAENA